MARMTHPENSMLLAYVRQQQRETWPEGIQQHVEHCPRCRALCAEFVRIGATLETWMHSRTYQADYAIADSVMRQVHAPKPSFMKNVWSGVSQPTSVRLASPSVAMLLVILFAITVGIFLLAHPARMAHPGPRVNFKLTVQPQVTTSVPPLPGITPTAGQTNPAGSGTTPPPFTQNKASLHDCTTALDRLEQHLHICGRDFTSGATLMLALVGANGKIKQDGPVQVNTDGTWQYIIPIHSCKDVPASIYARYTTASSGTVPSLNNIQYGDCQTIGIP